VDDAQLARRFGVIEQQLRLVSERLGIPCPSFASDGLTSDDPGQIGSVRAAPGVASGVPAEVIELAQAGQTTQAISRLRHLTGATLIEAKRIVDAL